MRKLFEEYFDGDQIELMESGRNMAKRGNKEAVLRHKKWPNAQTS